MFSAVIIDDEAKGRLALHEKLKGYCPQVTVVAEAASGAEGLAAIELHKPQVVFLDIEMPGMNGFEMLNHLLQKNFHLIFTTAYDQYAIKAIKYAAFDYLLKPVDIEELKTAIEKLIVTKNIQTSEQAAVLKENLAHPKPHLNKLALATVEGLLFFDINEIVHLEAASNYTTIYLTSKQKITASKTLKDFEELLPADTFFRTHHSHIINLNFIKKYYRGDGGQIELTNGSVVDVSRRKKDDFLKLIGN